LALYHPIKRPGSVDDLLPRGGGATVAEVGGNLSLWAMNERVCELHWRGKFRGPGFEPILFKMEKPFYAMEFVDKKGRALPTVVAVHATDADAEENEAKEVFQERRLLAAMIKSPEASISDWARECQWLLPGKSGEQLPCKMLVYRVLKRLLAANLVKKGGSHLRRHKDRDAVCCPDVGAIMTEVDGEFAVNRIAVAAANGPCPLLLDRPTARSEENRRRSPIMLAALRCPQSPFAVSTRQTGHRCTLKRTRCAISDAAAQRLHVRAPRPKPPKNWGFVNTLSQLASAA
jgi:hypothetical protein